MLFTVCVTSAGAAIDLTPVPAERVLDGIKFQQLIFQDNGRKIAYEQPRGWKFTASKGSIAFTPPDVTQAEAAIEQSVLEKPQNFDEPTMKLLQEQVLASLPASSEQPAVVGTEKNPVMINRHETFEVTVAYKIGGVDFERSVLFLNLPDAQVRFRVSARKQDFEKIHKAFRGSVYSWQWL